MRWFWADAAHVLHWNTTLITHAIILCIKIGGMAELVDALDLGSSGATHKSSILFIPTTNFRYCAQSAQLRKLSVPP